MRVGSKAKRKINLKVLEVNACSNNIPIDECLTLLKYKFKSDWFDDGEVIFLLLQSGKFESKKELAQFLEVPTSIVGEALKFYLNITVADQAKLRSMGKVTREGCRQFLESSRT